MNNEQMMKVNRGGTEHFITHMDGLDLITIFQASAPQLIVEYGNTIHY